MSVTEAELEKALHERDRAREREALERAAVLDPEGPCPACGARLAAGPRHPALAPLVARPDVRCTKCSFAAPVRPSALGRLLALVVAVVVGLVGLRIVLDAQQLTDGTARLLRFAFGGGLLCAGFWLGSTVQQAANVRALGQRIAASRREVEEGPRKGPPPTWLGENLRELAFAAILYLILRHFAVEAFVIPTGSMAPTLLGNNYRVTCERCEYPFSVGKSEAEQPVGLGRARCPVCRDDFVFDRAETVSDGNKILVNKLVYRVRPPERYEVVVFRNPKMPWESYIKRVVGLPGDTLQVKRGDLYVNGALAPKPPSVQDAVWIPVFDGRYRFDGLGAVWAPPPGAEPPDDAWEVARDGGSVILRPGPRAVVAVDFDREQGGVRDTTSYNSARGEFSGYDPVRDLRVRAVVTPARGAVVRLSVVEDGREVTATFPAEGAASGAFTVEAGGQALASTTARRPLAADRPVEVALAYADERVRIFVDGAPLLPEPAHDAGASTARPALATARLGASGGQVTFEAVRIDRDIHYVAGGSGFSGTNPAVQPVTVPPGRYFALGDNSPSSADGRTWGFLHEGHVQGRAFLVWWPPRAGDLRLVR
ncbi:MAG: signal peptidase I [Planctomycetes bacterium]|nr:signal peptidase I [Planctomycetota bacterium]